MGKTKKDTSAGVPRPYSEVGKHPVFPDVSHDETARYNFIANLDSYLSSVVMPGNNVAFERRVKPQYVTQAGHDFQTHEDLKQAMIQDASFQMWSALHRSTTEMRQQTGRAMALRQLNDLASKASQYTNQRPDTLQLDPTVTMPTYLTVAENHAMPGGYSSEYVPNDVSSAANYDAGLFVRHAGSDGALSDGQGRALVAWLKRNYPDFNPAQILDLGCGTGNNTLPLAIGYPAAQVTGIDVSAAMLRYGHARSIALNVPTITFRQANAEALPYPDESIDWVQTTSFLHETSKAAIEAIIREIHRVLKPGGLMLNLEQPQYTPDVHLFEQFMREWKAQLTNMPFRSVMYGMGMKKWMVNGGFHPDDLLQFSVGIVDEKEDFTKPSQAENYTPSRAWNVFGAWKRAAQTT